VLLHLWNAPGITSLAFIENMTALIEVGFDVVTIMGLDLKPGSPNRAIVDNLIDQGVEVEWEEGNTIVE
jgi:hypothetical protein